jgi:hypothetical protein
MKKGYDNVVKWKSNMNSGFHSLEGAPSSEFRGDHVQGRGRVTRPEGGERTTERLPGTTWGGPAEPMLLHACERLEKTPPVARPPRWNAPSGKSGRPRHWVRPAATGILPARRQCSTHRSGRLERWSTIKAWQCTDLPATSSPFFCRLSSRVSRWLDATTQDMIIRHRQ